MDLATLQNGSDIRGIAITNETETANLTPAAVAEIGKGLVAWLRQMDETGYQQGKLKVGIGYDSRLSGPALKEALMNSLLSQGIDVIDFAMATTPAMFMATQFPQFDCDASIMLTASHLPYYFNGIKIFSRKGGAEKADIKYILTHLTENTNGQTGAVSNADLITPYAADLVTKIRKGMQTTAEKPLAGLKIIVDAGNGAGGYFAEQVLAVLGADTTGSQFLEPDGHFPNHIPNPDNKEAMASIQAAVLATGADLGVIFDTDVDRSAIVAKNGEAINRNNLIAVLSSITLAEHPGTRIVTNSPTTNHLKAFIEAKGGIQVRYISGYRNVINKAIALNEAGLDCQLAIETSGHAAFKENYFLDDGAYVIAKILMLLPQLQKEGRSIDEIIRELKQPVETIEFRFKLAGTDYRPLGEKVIAELPAYLVDKPGFSFDPENEEGVRYTVDTPYGSGWFLLRMSLHEPLLVLQVENDSAGNNRKVLAALAEHFTSYAAAGVDAKNLVAYLAE
ncbi:phosphomannomutase [Enterococcus sp. PF1-24]|uniref:phosphomannomutase/phosphoglucomutase n=1 Tax=unclassified Enterococcus TaxID=2608891 RepID=UPI0024746BF1|nr:MULTISPECIES: phosphomannomutase/phosphoglucomutase [unclassified Enterococcus]MDH6365066.1 phosphomannomutase [Enterococcus sp. PFB1-1]MDH6402161.1 phosphomannomutase [Enterococcus sp. PF1-24]